MVFTNGCFDLLHPGHVDLLRRARELGDRLVVGINSDRSVRAIKGPHRPLQSEQQRAAVLAAIRYVDEVIIFDESTPARLIEEIKPDILVKGGDWPVEQIVGADSVLRRGGNAVSLPLLPGFSTTSMIERLRQADRADAPGSTGSDGALAGLAESIVVKQRLLQECADAIECAGRLLVQALRGGNKVLLFGNGGSAADAQHMAAEIIGGHGVQGGGLPAIALTADSSVLTAVANDNGFEAMFARQVEALAQPGDVAIGISTSGNSVNVINGIMAARSSGCKTIGLTGAGGRRLAGLCDIAVLAPSTSTARIQECHITICHLWSELVDRSRVPQDRCAVA
jgi:D-sedoheptulose 7-phosphate isomerase